MRFTNSFKIPASTEHARKKITAPQGNQNHQSGEVGGRLHIFHDEIINTDFLFSSVTSLLQVNIA